MPQHDIHDFVISSQKDIEEEYSRIRKRANEDPGTAGDQGEENWASLLRRWLLSGVFCRVAGNRRTFDRLEAALDSWACLCAMSWAIGNGSVFGTDRLRRVAKGSSVYVGHEHPEIFLLRVAGLLTGRGHQWSGQFQLRGMPKTWRGLSGSCHEPPHEAGANTHSGGAAAVRELVHCRYVEYP